MASSRARRVTRRYSSPCRFLAAVAEYAVDRPGGQPFPGGDDGVRHARGARLGDAAIAHLALILGRRWTTRNVNLSGQEAAEHLESFEARVAVGIDWHAVDICALADPRRVRPLAALQLRQRLVELLVAA